MTASDLTRIKAVAQAVTGDVQQYARQFTPEAVLRFMRHVTPAAVVELVERLERAEAQLRPAAANGRGLIDAVDAAMVEMANIHPPLRRSECERLIRAALAPRTPAADAATDPNDPLDDVLPLAREPRVIRSSTPTVEESRIERFYAGPLGKPWTPELPDSEGGHHD